MFADFDFQFPVEDFKFSRIVPGVLIEVSTISPSIQILTFIHHLAVFPYLSYTDFTGEEDGAHQEDRETQVMSILLAALATS